MLDLQIRQSATLAMFEALAFSSNADESVIEDLDRVELDKIIILIEKWESIKALTLSQALTKIKDKYYPSEFESITDEIGRDATIGELIQYQESIGQAGNEWHDLAYTANGCGAGFFDGDYGVISDLLDSLAHTCGSIESYCDDDDGKLIIY